jgi:hypothetical protein
LSAFELKLERMYANRMLVSTVRNPAGQFRYWK